MKIPEKVKIGGVNYEIRDVENLNDGQSVLYGKIDYENFIIELNTKYNQIDHKCIVLLHEILHGILNQVTLEVENEELLVEVMSKGLYQIIKDNPEIFKE